jgi:hypothetical protein
MQREIRKYPAWWQNFTFGGMRREIAHLLAVAPTILTTKKRRTSMTRRVERWAQLD